MKRWLGGLLVGALGCAAARPAPTLFAEPTIEDEWPFPEPSVPRDATALLDGARRQVLLLHNCRGRIGAIEVDERWLRSNVRVRPKANDHVVGDPRSAAQRSYRRLRDRLIAIAGAPARGAGVPPTGLAPMVSYSQTWRAGKRSWTMAVGCASPDECRLAIIESLACPPLP